MSDSEPDLYEESKRKYRNDPLFHELVNRLRSFLKQGVMDPVEMCDAANFAAVVHLMEDARDK